MANFQSALLSLLCLMFFACAGGGSSGRKAAIPLVNLGTCDATRPCGSGQKCIYGLCRTDCATTTCPTGTYCETTTKSCLRGSGSATPTQPTTQGGGTSTDTSAPANTACTNLCENTCEGICSPVDAGGTMIERACESNAQGIFHCVAASGPSAANPSADPSQPGGILAPTPSTDTSTVPPVATVPDTTTTPTTPPACVQDCTGKKCGQADNCNTTCGTVSDAGCPAAEGQLLASFESSDFWSVGDQPNGSLSVSTEQANSGKSSAKISYNFPGSGNDFVVLLKSMAISGNPTKLALYIYGDGKGHLVNAWIKDSGGTTWSIPFGSTSGTGWQKMTGTISATLPWPGGKIDGSGSTISFPISIRALVVDDVPDTFSGSGSFYVDDLLALP